MKQVIKKLGLGVAVILVSIAMINPALAQNDDSKLKISASLQALSQFTLVSGKLSEISATSLPAQLKIMVKAPVVKGVAGNVSENSRMITVAVDEKTIFSRNVFGAKSSLAELSAGDSLQVFGRYNDQGILQALSVKDASIRLTAKAITGSISDLNADAKTFTLSHLQGFSAKWLPLTIRINDQTKIVSTDGKALTFADLQLNQKASVQGVLNTQARTLIASEVRVKVAAPTPLPFSLQGSLSEISTTSLPAKLTVKVTDILPPLQTNTRALMSESIDMVTFLVDANTKLISHSGAAITLANLAVGDSLIVQGKIDSAGNITATIVRDDSVEVDMTMAGSIESLDSTAQTFVLVKADGSKVNVAVNKDATLVVPGISSPTFADLKIGYMAEVKGILNFRTNGLAASSVKVTEIPQPLPFSFQGSLTAISTTSLPALLTVKVSDILPPLEMKRSLMSAEPIDLVTFQVTADSKLISKSGATISLANFRVGDTLVVQGNISSAGTISASIVRNDSGEVTVAPISGTISAINAAAQNFSFKDSTGAVYSAWVDSNTKFSVPGITNPTFADLYVGNTVDVNGVLNLNSLAVQTSAVTVTATSTSSTTH